MGWIPPILFIKGSQKGFLPLIALLDDSFGTLTTDIGSAHHSRNPVRERCDDLYVQRCRDPGKKKLSSASKNHDIVQGGNFRNRRTHHLAVNLLIVFEPGKLFDPN